MSPATGIPAQRDRSPDAGGRVESKEGVRVLVAYATRHGATEGIAEAIGETLRVEGIAVDVRPVSAIGDMAAYDAYVIGSAAYMFHWLKEATNFVRRARTLLREKPTWLFSSGPLGTEPLDAHGRDQKVAAVPKELPGLAEEIHARDAHVFFGAYSRAQKPIGLGERFVSLMPAARDALPEGDFRDWAEVRTWAQGIARELMSIRSA